jgi:hypothetical protein
MKSLFTKPKKSPMASFVLSLMDSVPDGSQRYNEFVSKAVAVFQVPRNEIEKELDLYI